MLRVLKPGLNQLVVIFLSASTLPLWAQESKEDSLKNLLPNAKDTTEIGILNQLSEATRKKKPLDAITYGDQALVKAEKTGFKKGQMRALHNIGLGHGFNNDYIKANEFLVRSATLAEELKDWKTAANDYMNIGSIYAIEGNNEQWIESYLKALKLFEKIGDKKGIASVLYGIGNSLASEKKFDQALENYFKSIGYFEELGEKREIPKVQVNVGRAYEDMKDYASALEWYGKSLEGFSAFDNRRGRASALTYRANTYFLLELYDQALKDLQESIDLSNESNYKVAIVESHVLMGKVYKARKNYDQAVNHLLQAVAIAKNIGSSNDLSTAYQLLAEVYSAKGDFKNAFIYQGYHQTLYDSVNNAAKNKQIQEMQFRFDTESKAKEIELLKRDRFLNRIYLGVALLGVLSVLIIGFLVINRQKLKIRIDRELAQKENQLLEERKSLIEAELLNRKLNEEQLRNEIAYKNKEMTTYALNLIQKNELLDNIKGGIEEIRASEPDQIKLKLQSLLNTVNFSFHLDKDWENFRKHFEQVHQSFFDKLLSLYPDLGPNDIKLCALIRLNLDTKQMATILDISPESAKVARHRLRKKLNLTTDQNLANYLSGL